MTTLIGALVVATMIGVLSGTVTQPAEAVAMQSPTHDAGMESRFIAAVNQTRTARGLNPLTPNGGMTSAARSWTYSMASGTFLAHASDIVSGTPGGWSKVGENVGRGQTVDTLMTAFMNSALHAKNLLDPSYTHIGVGVYVHPNGRVYTTHRFAALPGSSPAPPPVQPTAVPVVPTAVPVVPTAVPVVPTAVPVVPTAVPVVPTAVPVVPTAAPVVPTAAPVVPTAAPVVPTAAPVVPTAAPVVPTAAPVAPTATPVPATPTAVPPATPAATAQPVPAETTPQQLAFSTADESPSTTPWFARGERLEGKHSAAAKQKRPGRLGTGTQI